MGASYFLTVHHKDLEGEDWAPYVWGIMLKELKQGPVHVGGCIKNRSPLDMNGDQCDCYKIRFSVCAWLEYHSVELCREWVAYMTSSAVGRKKQEDIIQDAVCAHFGIIPSSFIRRKIVPKAKAAMEAVAVLGYVPEEFREIVMCNRYGRVENHISVRWILTEGIEKRAYMGMYGTPNSKLREFNSWGIDLAYHNIDLYRRFICALYNIANNKKLTKHRGFDIAYGMNPAQAAFKLMELKINNHEADEQQVSAALSV